MCKVGAVLALVVSLVLAGCGQAAAPAGSVAASGSAETAAASESTGVALPSTAGALSVSGTQLVGESGQAVQLRGPSTHGLAWFPQYVNADFFSELRQDWNANVVRLAMYTAESGGYCTDGNKEELLQLIDDGVKYATEADLYVIIDWHILSDTNPLDNKSEALEFFKTVSAKYADHNNVLYEICNEPNGSTSWDDIKTYANEVIPVIRENAPESVIIVGTPTWSQDVDKASADPLEFDNVMYALHFYAATHKDDLRAKLTAAHEAGLPVFVSEFGICDASGNGAYDMESANAWVELLDSYGASYVSWNLSNKDESSAWFKSNCDKVSGFEDADLSDEALWFKSVMAGEGAAGSSESSEAASALVTAAASAASSAKASSGTDMVYEANGVTWEVKKTNSWTSGSQTFNQYVMTVTNNSGSAIDGWGVYVNFNQAPSLSDSWNGSYSVDGNSLSIKNADYNGNIASGSNVSDIGFIVSGDAKLALVE